MIPWKYRPGAGFVVLVATLVFAAAFLAWGASRPGLDAAWATLIELEIGRDVPLADIARLGATMQRHPGLADNVVDGLPFGLVGVEEGVATGRIVIAVRQKADPAVRLVVQPAGTTAGAVSVRAGVAGTRKEGRASAAEPFTWRIPDDGPFPQITTIEIEQPEADGVRWSTVVRLEEEAAR